MSFALSKSTAIFGTGIKNDGVQAEQELAESRLLQATRRYQAMGRPSIQEVIGEGVYEDEPPDD